MRASNTDNSTAKPVIYINTGSEVFYHHTGATRIAGGAGSLPLNQWNHLVVQRVAGVTRMFVGGVQKGANYTDSTNYPTALVSLGAVSVGVAASMQGWMQEARFTIGNLAGRYSTAGFTPPTVPFSNY
jgi:hypothetical protein